MYGECFGMLKLDGKNCSMKKMTKWNGKVNEMENGKLMGKVDEN